MGAAAVAAARAIHYTGAGTIEFLVVDEQFYFMEMNTRLQVEHPVTEMITGLDLVEWQLKVAAGESLPLKQKQLISHGHAFEARIYAEDPYKDFLPAIGKIIYLKTPTETSTVRLDSGFTTGDEISPYYDAMLAKLIVWAEDRTSALQQLTAALAQFQLVGLQTNLDLLTNISRHAAFIAGDIHTNFINQHQDELFNTAPVTDIIQILATLYIVLQQKNKVFSPWHEINSWRLNLPAQQKISFNHGDSHLIALIEYVNNACKITLQEKIFHLTKILLHEAELQVEINGDFYQATIFYAQPALYILVNGQRYQLTYADTDNADFLQASYNQQSHLTAPMPGKIVMLYAKTGDQVNKGEPLAILEAMKMEHTIHAPYTGIIKEWYFSVGDLVSEGAELLAFDEVTKSK